MPPSDLLQYNEDIRIDLLKMYGRTPETIRADIESIKEWAKKQPHLPQIPSDSRIETFLFISKFVFAKTKKVIDMYFTVRGIWPEFFKDPEDPGVLCAMNLLYFMPLPKLTPTNYRVIFFKLRATDEWQNLDVDGYYSYTMNLVELLITEDCNVPKILFYDAAHMPMEAFQAFSPLVIKKSLNICQEVYSNRLEAIHILNAPPGLEPVMALIKSFLKPKLSERIHLHKSIDSVFEYIPKEIFPQDYGGHERSTETLYELWKTKISNSFPLFRAQNKLRTDESKRRENILDSEIMGFEGNFRKLNVD